MTLNKRIYFWFNQPPKVEVGAYNFLSTKMACDIYYICYKDLPVERKKLNWESINYGNAKLIVLEDDLKSKRNQAEKLINKSRDEIHIVCGLSGSVADLVCPIFKKNKIKFCVVSERPHIVFDSLKDKIRAILLTFKHHLKYRKYNSCVLAFLALGDKGVSQFNKLGWSKEKLFHFMYCGDYSDLEVEIKKKNNELIRFLYIGRFNYMHGLDILMKAFDLINDELYIIDMAGGYGDYSEKVKKWLKTKKNGHFIGMIDTNKVRETISQYDVLLVPSRMDGWNCQINEALSVNTPVITTKEAVSSELVVYSGAGISINNLSYVDYSRAIEYAIDNSNIISEWSELASKYKKRFSSDEVGKYLHDILCYVYLSGKTKPTCPWENDK